MKIANFILPLLLIGGIALYFVLMKGDSTPDPIQNDTDGQAVSTDNIKEEPTPKNIKTESPKMVHLVFFDIKDEMSENQLEFLEKEIKKLSKIESVKEFHLGEYEDLGDDRALTGREMMVSMKFKNLDDYYSYQKDERHFEVKKVIGPYLEKLPMSYDYMIQ